MPQYLYENQKTGEIREVFQKMTDIHQYSENGVKWRRVYLSPNASVDSRWDAMDSKDFVEKSRGHIGSLGDLMDKSAELSQKREQIIGKDPLKEKFQTNWSKRRKGKLHPVLKENKLKESLDKKGLTVSFD